MKLLSGGAGLRGVRLLDVRRSVVRGQVRALDFSTDDGQLSREEPWQRGRCLQRLRPSDEDEPKVCRLDLG